MEATIVQLREQAQICWSEHEIRKKLESPAFDVVRDREIQHVLKKRDAVSAIFEDAISRIRTYRRLAFIHRLPVELLSKVLRAASEHGLDVPTSCAIPSVCLHWRNVAYSDPRMWTRYNLAYSRPSAVLKALIQRSRPCSLEFYGHVATEGYSWDFKMIKDNINRISSIQKLKTPFRSPYSEPFLTAPLLRHIGICNNLPFIQTVFPRCPFIKDAPLLTSLELTGCRLPWRRALYSNLTRLRLLNARNDPLSVRYSWVFRSYCSNDADIDILEILYGSPNLEHLEIQFPELPLFDIHIPSPNFSSTLGHTPFPMRTLRTLVLDMPDEHAMRLLTGITLPESFRKLDLIVRCIRRTDVLDTLLQFRYLPAVFFPNIRSLSIARNAPPSPFFAPIPGSILFDGAGRIHDQDEYQFTLRFESSNTIMAAYTVQQLLATHVDMPRLRKFSLSENNPESIAQSADSLARLLLNLPSLNTLVLDGAGFFTSFERLHRALLEATEISPNLPIPRLESVHIKGPECGWAETTEFTKVVPLLRLFQAHLRELRIGVDRFICIHTAAMQLVESVRSLDVPEVWWVAPFYGPKPSNFGNVTTYARNVWPSGEPYTWRCKNEIMHSGGESPSQCAACGAAVFVIPVVELKPVERVVPAVPGVSSQTGPFVFGNPNP